MLDSNLISTLLIQIKKKKDHVERFKFSNNHFHVIYFI